MTTTTTLNLTKGEELNLTKAAVTPLTKVTIGAGWDPAREGEKIDLDLSAILYNAGGTKVSQVYFNEKASHGVSHTGDNLTGEGDGDDEQINVDLAALSADVKNVIFTLTSYSGQKFDAIQNAFARAVNAADGAEMARFEVSGLGPVAGLYICQLTRTDEGFVFKALGDTSATGKTFADMESNASVYVR